MPDPREITSGHFTLEVNGGNAGFVKKFSGLVMEADNVSSDLGPDNVQKKHVAGTRWTPGRATIGIAMGEECYQWINAAFDHGYASGSGSLTAADSNDKAISIWAFEDAFITSLTVPRLEGSSKESGYFELEFEAEQVRWSAGGGAEVRGKVGPKQKAWLCSNFRFEMGGLPCNRVASIDSFTWTCAVDSDQTRIAREPTRHPAKVTVPDIKLSISMADYAAWAESARKWFVDGQHLADNQMQGRVVFLDSNMKDEIGGIDLLNCGFKKFSQGDFEAGTEKIARFNVDLYVEKMTFKLKTLDARR